MATAPDADATTEPTLVVRYDSTAGALITVSGALIAATGTAVSGTMQLIFLGIGSVTAIFGFLWALGRPFVLIYPDQVKLKTILGTNGKSYPIDGLNDLGFSPSKLTRRSDNKTLANWGMGTANKDDLKQVKAAVTASQS